MRPSSKEIKKIWNWTKKDIEELFKPFYVNIEKGEGGFGPTNGYAIYLFSMMDLWVSIFDSKFNVHGKTRENIALFLKKLKEEFPDLYNYGKLDYHIAADELRNNIIHNYGLRVISTGNKREWLNIDINSTMEIINLQENERWHIDVMRLKDHILEIIEKWLIKYNYL